MNICMCGIGSIGTRHLQNLHTALNERGTTPRIDAVRKQNKPLPTEVQKILANTYTITDEIPGDYDIVFVTNPTSMHYETIKAMIDKTRHIFIEKPLFERIIPDLKSLPWKPDGVYYVACPLRYSSVICYLKEYLQDKPVYSARVICSTYLPEWRPESNYKQSYSAKHDMGGGVRLDLIHEWDYVNYLFGIPVEIAEFHGSFSNLGIDSEDTAVYIAKYPDKVVSIHLDYYGRVNRREIEIITDDDIIVGDMINQNVRFLHSEDTISLPQERNDMYLKEISGFLDMVDGKRKNINSIEQAMNTLTLALGRMPS